MAELQARMSSREFTAWLAYDTLDPIGAARGDLQAGIVASTVANAYRDPKKRPKPFAPADFMPLVDPDEGLDPEERGRQMWSEIKGWALGAQT